MGMDGNINIVVGEMTTTEHIGVWLSLARALDLGSRGRRFESCHPDRVCGCSSMVEH